MYKIPKSVLIFLFLVPIDSSAIKAQIIKNNSPDYYKIPVKRMLVKAVGIYLNQVTQGQLDIDSATVMACQLYGINRLLPYNEEFDGDQNTPGMVLINSGKIDQAKHQLTLSNGNDKVIKCFELAAYYLFKPGNNKIDLGNTKLYLDMISTAIRLKGYLKWQNECNNLYGQYYAQSGDMAKCNEYLNKVVKSAKEQQDEPALAAALLAQARSLPFESPERLNTLNQALKIAQKLNHKILEFQVLSEIFTIHFTSGNPLAEKDIIRIIALEKALGFRHLQYAYNVFAYMGMRKSDYNSAFACAQLSLKYMQETGDMALATIYYQRMAQVIALLSSLNNSLAWYQKSIDITKTKENQVFWYKGFLMYAKTLITLERYKEAQSLIVNIGTRYPPNNKFDQMELNYATGECYEHLGEYNKAEQEYQLFLGLASQIPGEYIHGEFPLAYLGLARFYFERKKYDKAKLFIRKAVSSPHGLENILNERNRFLLLFKLDSVSHNYASAIKNYQAYKDMYDSVGNVNQRQKYDELQIRFESVNKDKNIKLLKQNNEMQSVKLRQDVFFRNMVLGAVVLVSIIAGLLYYLYRLKQRSNIELQDQQKVLQRLINEKEWLVKEIHHRVKNNLHTIVSLLESQSAFLNNDDAMIAVRDSQHRVHTMSLIHQKLYMGDNMQTINSVDYIKELLSYLIQSFKLEGNINFETEIDSVDLDVTLAIPLGLIINEAVTNSIKYAFTKPGGSVKISLKESGVAYQLKIVDDGIGLPKKFDINKRISSLGMTLMKGLSKEIGAKFTITSDKGTSIVIVFSPYKFTD